MLVVSCKKLSLVPNIEMRPKSPSQSNGLASWFSSYRMTIGVLGAGAAYSCTVP